MKSKIYYTMKGYELAILCLMMSMNLSFGQSTADIGMPASPNAASLAKYGEVPVNLSSGIANVSIPLCEVSTKNVSVPVTLSYHNTGLKAEEVPSWVGLGWDLNVGGVITRQVRGKVDEGEFGVQYYKSDFDYYLKNYDNNDSVGLKQYLNNLALGFRDSEFDLFSFNFLGKSGSFMMDENMNIFFMPKSKLKIEVTKLSYSITKFVVTDEKGIEYEFNEALNTSSSYNRDMQWPADVTWENGGNSSWFLTKITDTNGEQIVFSYSNLFTLEYERSTYSASVTHDIYVGNLTGASSYPCIINMDDSGKINQTINEIYLETITFPQGTVEFNRSSSPRNDLIAFNSLEFLDEVTVKTNGASPVTVKSVQLTHDNNSNRLLLTNVDFVEGSSSYGYDFEYYSGLFPIDLENNLLLKDYWGYAKGSSSTSASQIPKQRFDFGYCVNLLFNGGDRNAATLKGGMLKSLTYPTGGRSEFEYENNDYFFDGAISDLPSAVGIQIEDQYKERIFDEDTNPSGNEIVTNIIAGPLISEWSVFYSLSINGSGGEKAKVSIKNITNNTIALSEETSSSANGNLSISVIPGHTYELKLSPWDINLNGFVHLTIDQIDYESTIGPQQQGDNLPLGGQRISKVTNYTGSNEIASVKRYVYELGKTGKSSGKMRGNLRYLSTSISGNYEYEYHTASLSSSYLDPLNGYHVYYPEVQVLYGNNAENGLEVHHFYDQPQQTSNPPFPFVDNRSWRDGLTVRKSIYDNRYNLVRETINTYDFNDDVSEPTYSFLTSYKLVYQNKDIEHEYNSPYNMSTFHGQYDLGLVENNFSEFMHPATTTVTDYYGAETITKTTTYQYDNPTHLQITKQTETNSDGFTETRFRYPDDDWSGDGLTQSELDAITQMKSKHIVGAPLEVTTYKEGLEKLSSTHSQYVHDIGLDLVLLSEQKKAVGNAAFDTEIFFTKYDSRGNVLEFRSRDGISNALIWGYNQQYVVARIQNATYAQVEAELGSPLTLTGDVLSPAQINTLKTQLPNSLVTTYVHEPLVGLTQQTDPNGIKTTYEYDDFGRLYWVKDDNDNLLKKYEYQISGN